MVWVRLGLGSGIRKRFLVSLLAFDYAPQKGSTGSNSKPLMYFLLEQRF